MNDLFLILSKIAYVCFSKNHKKQAHDKIVGHNTKFLRCPYSISVWSQIQD